MWRLTEVFGTVVAVALAPMPVLAQVCLASPVPAEHAEAYVRAADVKEGPVWAFGAGLRVNETVGFRVAWSQTGGALRHEWQAGISARILGGERAALCGVGEAHHRWGGDPDQPTASATTVPWGLSLGYTPFGTVRVAVRALHYSILEPEGLPGLWSGTALASVAVGQVSLEVGAERFEGPGQRTRFSVAARVWGGT